MKIRTIAAGAGVAAVALAGVLPAGALAENTAGLTGSVGATINVGGSASSNANSGAGASAGGTAGAGARVTTDVDTDMRANATGTSDGRAATPVAAGDIDSDGRADVQGAVAAEVLSITRADLDNGGIDSASWSARTASDVKSNADLKGYVAAQMQNDTNLSAVESSGDDVAVTYKQRGRFLGFIPVTLDATAIVDGRGQVTVKYPWYAFLTATDRADLQAKLQARVDAMVQASGTTSGTAGNSSTTPNAAAVANANANASFKLTADTQARVIAEMRRVMGEELKASADASAKTDVSATTNTQ